MTRLRIAALICGAMLVGSMLGVLDRLAASTLAVSKTWGTEVLTSADLNGNFTDVITWANGNISDVNISSGGDRIDPAKLDDFSTNAAEAQTQTDPDLDGAGTLASDLTGELARLRYVLATAFGETFWYQANDLRGFTTGDVKLTLKTTADTGWVMMDDGSIGSAASGGTTRANADTVDLFTLLWDNVIDTRTFSGSITGITTADDTITVAAAHNLGVGDTVYITNVDTTPQINNTTQTVIATPTATTFVVNTDITVVTDGVGDWQLSYLQTSAGTPTTKGATAAADFAADKRVVLPYVLGKALAGADTAAAGTAQNATAHPVGGFEGDETHTLVTAEMPSHNHNMAVDDNDIAGNTRVESTNSAATGNIVTDSTGGDTAHNIMQPTVYMNVMVKL